MSELRIALIAEGPTDYEIIKAVLQAILRRTFILTPLQPEATRPEFGSGWGGVLKWCHQAGKSGCASLDCYPPLSGFDAVIIHVDADVASVSYADCGQDVKEIALRDRWGALPCALDCPPPLPTVERLEQTIAGWLGNVQPGKKTVFCIPSKSTGTWLAAACFPTTHPILRGGECDLDLEKKLARLKLDERIKKTTVTYRDKAPLVKNNWDKVRSECSSALRFESLLLSLIPAK